MGETVEAFSKNFHKENKNGPNRIHWVITWRMAMIEDEKLWKILKLALPHEVVINENHYQRYKNIYKWLNENSTGLWTHSQLLFVFEKEIDAFAFKLRWG